MDVAFARAQEIGTPWGPWIYHEGLFGEGRSIICGIRNKDSKSANTILRIQYGCVWGMALASTDCDCRDNRDVALAKMSQMEETCCYMYFRDHEAYGHGIIKKAEIVNAEKKLGLGYSELMDKWGWPKDPDPVLPAVPAILNGLKLTKPVTLMTDDPNKLTALAAAGVKVAGVVPLMKAVL